MNKDFIDYVSQNLTDDEKQQFLGYLSTFSPNLSMNFFEAFPYLQPHKWVPKQPEEILTPIGFYQRFGFRMDGILNSTEWIDFFDSLLTKDDAVIFKSLGVFRTRKNEMLLLRAGYRYGHPFVDDDTYNIMLSWYTDAFEDLSFFNTQAYDDDTYDGIMLETLRSAKIIVEEKCKIDEELKVSLDQEKSTSILPVLKYEDVHHFLSGTGFNKILFSLKIDGVNTKKGYRDGVFAAGLSRGRSSNSLDYTNSLRKIVPNEIQTDAHFVSVTSEAYVDVDYLEVLRKKYPDKNFKTPKSSAISMLRVSEYDAEDMQHLKVLSFDSDGLGSDKLEIYQNLQEKGFKVPPYIVVDRSEVPKTEEEFNTWLDAILDKIREHQIAENLPADGVVCEKIGFSNGTRKDQYSDSNIAIKFSHWSSLYYTSTVKNILVEQRRVNASTVLEIEPVVTEDGNVATRVNGASLAILINNGIKIGSEIKFSRKSSAYNVLEI